MPRPLKLLTNQSSTWELETIKNRKWHQLLWCSNWSASRGAWTCRQLHYVLAQMSSVKSFTTHKRKDRNPIFMLGLRWMSEPLRDPGLNRHEPSPLHTSLPLRDARGGQRTAGITTSDMFKLKTKNQTNSDCCHFWLTQHRTSAGLWVTWYQDFYFYFEKLENSLHHIYLWLSQRIKSFTSVTWRWYLLKAAASYRDVANKVAYWWKNVNYFI